MRNEKWGIVEGEWIGLIMVEREMGDGDKGGREKREKGNGGWKKKMVFNCIEKENEEVKEKRMRMKFEMRKWLEKIEKKGEKK